MKTYAQLASDIRVSTRHFHRLLRSGDARALTALKAALVNEFNMGLQQLANDCAEIGNAFLEADPEIADLLHKTCDGVREVIKYEPARRARHRELKMEGLS